jgi:hypothetical protein
MNCVDYDQLLFYECYDKACTVFEKISYVTANVENITVHIHH